MKLWLSDQGTMGWNAVGSSSIIGLEYPIGSGVEHLVTGGIWIGAIVDTGRHGVPRLAKLVTTSDNYDYDPLRFPYETITNDSLRPWFWTSIFDTEKPNKRNFDDDGDGLIDEDELDGNDNDRDNNIDEDYGAISEKDYYCSYNDTSRLLKNRHHKPLGIQVWQRSYAWVRKLREPIIVIEYNIINLGKYQLNNVYVGNHFGPWVETTHKLEKLYNSVGYWPNLMTAYVYNPIDNYTNPVGFTILSTPKRLSDLNYYFRWFNRLEYWGALGLTGNNDVKRYNLLSGAEPPNIPAIRPNPDIGYVDDFVLLFSYGPFNNWSVGETLKVAIAIVGGLSLQYGPDNLYDNARKAQTLFARDYHPFYVPPSPKLRIEQGYKSVTLNWGYTGTGINPIEAWDDENQLVRLYPTDHWRRINPPYGHTRGGRVFEGYRLYRSEDPAGVAASFTMLRQWDMIDSVGLRYGSETGIETTFVEENLMTGKTYWYSITSYGIPDVHLMEYLDLDGTVKKETLATESLESSLLESRKRTKIKFSVSHELNKVLVVPNPYRVDEEYTYEMGGYEGRAKVWTENKRLLKFIHLPPKCTIRIFTLSGDIITTLHHGDAVRGELDWNLLSESNRTIASGVYVFTVESEYGTQMGKFVVIR